MDLVARTLPLPGGELHLFQPSDAADLPDDGDFDWAPMVPYWSVVWRSGMLLAREVERSPVAGLRVVELGCGLGIASLAAARAGATVLATDGDPEAIELLSRNARENGLELETALIRWDDADALIARGPFDLVLTGDLLYEQASVPLLLSLLPRLGREVWLADPGRKPARAFLEQARASWSVETEPKDQIELHRLRAL